MAGTWLGVKKFVLVWGPKNPDFGPKIRFLLWGPNFVNGALAPSKGLILFPSYVHLCMFWPVSCQKVLGTPSCTKLSVFFYKFYGGGIKNEHKWPIVVSELSFPRFWGVLCIAKWSPFFFVIIWLVPFPRYCDSRIFGYCYDIFSKSYNVPILTV